MCFKILVVIYLMTQGRHSNAALLQRLPFRGENSRGVVARFPRAAREWQRTTAHPYTPPHAAGVRYPSAHA